MPIFAHCNDEKMSLYSDTAELLQFVAPGFYKKRYFKKLDGITAENIFERKIEPEMLWLKHFLPKDAVIADVGANVGSYLYLLEGHLQPEHIYAFEPNPVLHRRLHRIFPKIPVLPVALSDENTVADFKIPLMNGREISSRGTLETSISEVGESDKKIKKVRRIRLDDWAEGQKLLRLDFLKIDVEGHEMAVLRAAKKTLERLRPTLMVEMEQRHHAEPLWNLIEEVQSQKYRAHYLCRQSMNLQPLSRKIIENQDRTQMKNYRNYINNIIFIPTK